MIAIDLSKQLALDAYPRAIQQINFTAKLDRNGNTTKFFIIKEAKKNCFRIFKRERKSFVNTILLIVILSNVIFIEYKVQFNFYQYKNDTIQ